MPLFAGSSLPCTSVNPALSRRPLEHGARVAPRDDGVGERRAGHEQHGRDQRAIRERRYAVRGQPFRHQDATSPRERRLCASRVDVEHLDRFTRAVADDIQASAPLPRCADVQAVSVQRLRRRRRCACAERSVGLRRERQRAPLAGPCVDEIEPRALGHTARDDRLRSRYEHEVLGVLRAANESLAVARCATRLRM